MSWGQDKMMGGVRKNETSEETLARKKRENGQGMNMMGTQTGRFSGAHENKGNVPKAINK